MPEMCKSLDTWFWIEWLAIGFLQASGAGGGGDSAKFKRHTMRVKYNVEKRPEVMNLKCVTCVLRIRDAATFGQHHLKSKSFTYKACQKQCVDKKLVIIHTKCVTSLGWTDKMSDSFRIQMGHTTNMTKYIMNRCMPKKTLIPIPAWISVWVSDIMSWKVRVWSNIRDIADMSDFLCNRSTHG